MRDVARRVKKRTSLLAPAENLIKRLAQTDVRVRRKVVRVGLWVVAVVFLYSFMSGTYGVPRMIRLTLEQKALQSDNHKKLVELIDAVRRRDLLRYDRRYIEYIARTQYHMARPDEIIYRYRRR